MIKTHTINLKFNSLDCKYDSYLNKIQDNSMKFVQNESITAVVNEKCYQYRQIKPYVT